MGKYDIGVRVSDPDGDEGTIIEKMKGKRQVQYEQFDDCKIWWLKRELAMIEPKPANEFKVGDRVVFTSESTGRGAVYHDGVLTVDGVSPDGVHVSYPPFGSWTDWQLTQTTTAESPAHFRLESGKTYRTRDGRKVGPMKPYAHSYRGEYPWTLDGNLWTDSGVNYDGLDDGRTIVGLWTEPSVEQTPVPAPATLTIEAGKFYRTRDGRKVGPMDRDSGLKEWPWRDPDNGDSYRDDGTFGVNEGEVFDQDLVAEWVEPAAGKADAATTTSPSVGQRVRPEGEHKSWVLSHWEEFWASKDGHGPATEFYVVDNGKYGARISDVAGGEGPYWTDVKWVVVAEPAKPQPKFKVGDVVNWTINRRAWQGIEITEVLDTDSPWMIRAKDKVLGIGAFSPDHLELVVAPPLAVGAEVVLTGPATIRQISGDRASLLMPSGGAFTLSTASLRIAA